MVERDQYASTFAGLKIMEDEIEVTITLSRAAYERAAQMAKDAEGTGGLAYTMTTEEFIERYLEIMLEPETPAKA